MSLTVTLRPTWASKALRAVIFTRAALPIIWLAIRLFGEERVMARLARAVVAVSRLDIR